MRRAVPQPDTSNQRVSAYDTNLAACQDATSCELWWHVYAQLVTCALDLHLVRASCPLYVVCCVLYVYLVCPVSQVLVLDADVQEELIARLMHLLGVADGRATNTSAAYAAHHASSRRQDATCNWVCKMQHRAAQPSQCT